MAGRFDKRPVDVQMICLQCSEASSQLALSQIVCDAMPLSSQVATTPKAALLAFSGVPIAIFRAISSRPRCGCICDCKSRPAVGNRYFCQSHCGAYVCQSCVSHWEPVICHWCYNPFQTGQGYLLRNVSAINQVAGHSGSTMHDRPGMGDGARSTHMRT